MLAIRVLGAFAAAVEQGPEIALPALKPKVRPPVPCRKRTATIPPTWWGWCDVVMTSYQSSVFIVVSIDEFHQPKN